MSYLWATFEPSDSSLIMIHYTFSIDRSLRYLGHHHQQDDIKLKLIIIIIIIINANDNDNNNNNNNNDNDNNINNNNNNNNNINNNNNNRFLYSTFPNNDQSVSQCIITPVIGLRINSALTVRFLHTLGSIPASRHFTGAHNANSTTIPFASYWVPI